MPEEVVVSLIERMRLADHRVACAMCHLNRRPCDTARGLLERVRDADAALLSKE